MTVAVMKTKDTSSGSEVKPLSSGRIFRRDRIYNDNETNVCAMIVVESVHKCGGVKVDGDGLEFDRTTTDVNRRM